MDLIIIFLVQENYFTFRILKEISLFLLLESVDFLNLNMGISLIRSMALIAEKWQLHRFSTKMTPLHKRGGPF